MIENANVRQAKDEMVGVMNNALEFVDNPFIGDLNKSIVEMLKHWIRLLETSEL